MHDALHPHVHSVKAFAPATCANVAVGFDILGFSFEAVGDHVTLTRRDDQQIVIEHIDSTETLPLDPDKNTASAVIKKVCQDLSISVGFSLRIQKGIPLSSGMGGSAASAVAALVAFNGFLSTPLSREQLAQYALGGEAIASGQAHGDNVVPCIWGGITLIRSIDPIDVVELPVPALYCVLVHPHLHVTTKEARARLSEHLSLTQHVSQSASLAGLIASLYQLDFVLMKKSMNDIVIEPQRASLVPGFYDIKHAAIEAGAIGVSFSGSGPTLFALAHTLNDAKTMAAAMQAQVSRQHIHSDYWIAPLSHQAAHVVQVN